MINKGEQLPAITLNDHLGNEVNLHDFIGKPLVIYFYPKDNTRVCTAQACSFRDRYEDFKELGAEVIGISKDSVKSHERVVNKRNLPFVLLSDRNGKAMKSFGLPSYLFGLMPARVTFIVDSKGVIQHTFRADFQAESHIGESIKILKKLSVTHP